MAIGRFIVGSAFVKLKADHTGLRSEIRRAVAAAGQQGVKVRLDVDATHLRARIKAATSAAGAGLGVKIRLDVDSTHLRARIKQATETAGVGQGVKVKVDPETTHLRSRITAATKAAGVGQEIKVGVGVRGLEALGAVAGPRALAASLTTARRALSAFNPLALATAGVVAALVPTFMSLASSAGLASGALMALPVAGGALVQGLFATGLAIQGLGTAMREWEIAEDLQEVADTIGGVPDTMLKRQWAKANAALVDLGEAGKSFVMFIREDYMPALRELQVRVRDAFFPGLESAMRRVMEHGEGFADVMAATAGIMGGLVDDFATMITGPQWLADLKRIGSANQTMLRQLGAVALDTTDIVKNLWVSALPLTIRFTHWLERSFDKLKDITQEAKDDGRLEGFFKKAGDEAAKWGRILGNVAAAIFNVFTAINDPARDFTANLETITRRWKEWTEDAENRDKMREFWEKFHAFDWAGLAKGLLIVAGALAAIRVSAGVFKLLGVLLSPTGLLGLAVAGLAAGFVTLFATNEDFRESVLDTAGRIKDSLAPAFENFDDVLREVGDALVPLADIVLTSIEDFVKGFADVLPDIMAHLPGFAKSMGDLATALMGVNDEFERMTGVSPAELLGRIAGASVLSGIQMLTLLFRSFTGTLNFWLATVRLAHRLWDAAWGPGGWAIGIWNGFWGFMSGALNNARSFISGVWQNIFSDVSGWWDSLWDTVGDRWSTFRGFLGSAFDSARSFASSTWQNIRNDVSGWWDSLWDIVGERWSTFRGFLGSAFDSARSFASSTWQNIRDDVSRWWDNLWDIVGDRWSSFRGFLGTAFASARDFASRTWQNIRDDVSRWWDNLWDLVGQRWSTFRNFITAAFNSATATLKSVWKSMTDNLAGWWSGLWNTVRGMWNRTSSFFTETIPNVFRRFRDTIKNVWNEFGEFAERTVNGIGAVFEKIPNAIGKPFNAALDILSSFAEKIKKIPGVGSLLNDAIKGLKKGLSIVVPVFGKVSFPGFAGGGRVRGPGTSISDSIDARLSNDEHVIPAHAARVIGHERLGAMSRNPGLFSRQGFKHGGPAFPSSPGAVRGDTGVWKGIVQLIKKWGGDSGGSFSNAYRPGDPLWHGSGLAVDWAGFNQDRLAGMFQAIQPDVLELIHQTNRSNFGITKGRNVNMGGQLPLHRDHIHIAMTKPSVEHHLGSSIPTSVVGGSEGGLMKTFKVAAQKIWKALSGGFGKALSPLDNVAFGPPIKKMLTTVPDKLMGWLDEKDPGMSGGTAASGPVPKGAIPAYFTYFGANPAAGFTDPNDMGLTASGVPPSTVGFSSPFWPLGTEATMSIAGKNMKLKQIDFGPAMFVVNRHPGKAVLDLTHSAMLKMLGRVGNFDGHVKVNKFGTGRTFPGNFRPRGMETGGKIPGTGNKDIEPALLAPGERVLTSSENQRLEAMAAAKSGGGLTVQGDLNVTIPAKDIEEMRNVKDFFNRIEQDARAGERRFE